MQAEALDTAVDNLINELKTNFEQQEKALKEYYENHLKEIQARHKNELDKLKINALEYEHKYLLIKERYDLLIYQRFMRSAERMPFDAAQPLLFAHEAEPVALPTEAAAQAEKTDVKPHTRSKRGRKPIDPAIRRAERILDIPEAEKTCACGAHLAKIGEEVSEKLEIIAPQIYVDRIVRPKYACPNCEGTEDEEQPAVRIAPVEPSMIPRGIATPSLLSTIFTHKFEDHLPYYRQEKQFQRIGVK